MGGRSKTEEGTVWKGKGENESIPRLHSPHLDLAPSCQRMPDQLPVQQVRRVVDGAAGEVLESAGREEVLDLPALTGTIPVVAVAHHTDGRVRVEAAEYGVMEYWGGCSHLNSHQ